MLKVEAIDLGVAGWNAFIGQEKSSFGAAVVPALAVVLQSRKEVKCMEKKRSRLGLWMWFGGLVLWTKNYLNPCRAQLPSPGRCRIRHHRGAWQGPAAIKGLAAALLGPAILAWVWMQ